MSKRRPISQLPDINRTPVLEKFFGTTVDHLFQPGTTASISGYIGRVPSYNDPVSDFYKPEPTASRTKYQLEATMVSRATDGTIQDVLFYDDLIEKLSGEGALVANTDRLFQSEYWSWAPPIDIDMVNNWQRYYWSGDDVPAVPLLMPGLEIPTITKGDGVNKTFSLPAVQKCWNILPSDQHLNSDGTVFDGCPQVRLNGVLVNGFTIQDSNTIVFAVAPQKGDVIEVFRYGNISDGSRVQYAIPKIMLNDLAYTATDVYVYIEGRPHSDFSVMGDHIVLGSAVAANSLISVTVFNSLEKIITGREYFNVENITNVAVTDLVNGLRISLFDPLTVFEGFDIKPNSAFKWDEFQPNEFIVDGVGVSIHLLDVSSSLLGLDPQHIVISREDAAVPYFSRINRWVQAEALAWFNGATVARQAKRPICQMNANMALWNYGRARAPDANIVYGIVKDYDSATTVDDFGNTPQAGDVVLFGHVGNDQLNNKFFIYPVLDDETGSSYQIGTVIDQSAPATLTLIANANVNDVFEHIQTGNEYHWNGASWIKCDAAGTFPLYDLFDNDGISIADNGRYPNSTFAGSRIFNYQVGTGINDTILGFPLLDDTYGAIMFQNYLYTETYSYRDGDIMGFLYYLTGSDQYDNQWYKSSSFVPTIGSTADVVVPLNLQANPNNGTPQYISRNNWFDHFSSIEINQDGYTGKPYADNNWQYTTKDLSRGTHIVQCRSPMLKLMMLMTDDMFDLKKAIKFSETEYTRYKLKIRQKIRENLNLGLYVDTMDDDAELVKILEVIAANKTSDFPFFLSRIGNGQYFIPATPACLGILPMVTPHSIVENGITYIVGHDGSKTTSVDSITDRILMAFEQRIFASRKDEAYVAETLPYVEEADLFSGKYRTGAYSRLEANVILQSSFEDWARANNSDYQTNSGYDPQNPFTWNYAELQDRDHQSTLPGNWRGIYRWYFDTEMPNLYPWEMLGFAEQPSWWEDRYGSSPYGRTNVAMWNDIEQGIIRDGPRAGIDSRYIRTGLMTVLPVDQMGNLLDPVQSRIVLNAPTIQLAQENWVFGDNSPIENLWRRSSSFAFAKATGLFLMRPAQFTEDYWDKDNRKLIHRTQWIDVLTNDRAASSELYVHAEILPDGSQKTSYGIQTWLVEYMIQHGQAPSNLGNIARGLDVRLAHKMAGFTTRDRLHVNAESFGIIPDEDIDISLYQSPGVSGTYYSGIMIEQLDVSRWRIIGYNSLDRYFGVEASDPNGKRIALTGQSERVVNTWTPNVYYKIGMFVLYEGYVYEAILNHTSMSVFEKEYWRQDESGVYADERIYKYLDGSGVVSRVPYATVMTSRQDVVEFLYGYQRNLEAIGFGFDAGNWDEAAKQFINWSKVRWSKGAFLAVSPGARSLTFTCDQGLILNLEGPLSTGSIVNRTGHVIDARNTMVDRYDAVVTITASGDDIYGVALRTGVMEHAMIFSNRTIYNDIIYDPVLNIRQVRLKLHARRTSDWSGRYDAPGFVISDGQIVSNFDKSAEDLRYMFDIELADNTILRDHARHVIGFETKDYLTDLLLNETQQFELYQGMIQQKGAPQTFSKIMRSKSVEGNRDLVFAEEWAFRISEFGAFVPRNYLEFIIQQSDLRRDRQIVRFGNSLVANNPAILTVANSDSRWITDPVNFTDIILPVDQVQKYNALPNAGYVRTNEATYTSTTIAAFTTQVATLLKGGSAFSEGESVWIYTADISGRWGIKYLVAPLDKVSGGPISIRVTVVDDNSTNGEVTGIRFTLDGNHNLSVGDTALVAGPIGTDYDLAGMCSVSAIGDDWFEIDTDDTDTGQAYDFTAHGEIGPLIFRMVDGRFRVRKETLNFPLADVPLYVDDKDSTVDFDPLKDTNMIRWGVFQSGTISTSTLVGTLLRSQPDQVDANRIVSSLIYEQQTQIDDTSISPQPISLARITPIDPMAGLIIGTADKEIDYRLEYDPASYSEDTGTVWTDNYIGTLWWDLSTCWFINPYTDDITNTTSAKYLEELYYRASNWSTLAVDSRVDIYEWTKGYTVPDTTIVPSGIYVQSVEYSGSLNKEVAVYFYWVKNPTVIPNNNIGRTLDAASCASLISNPTAAGVPWMAPITTQEMIITGVRDYITDDTTVLQLQLQLTDEDKALPHQQWMIVRPEDGRSQPSVNLWSKMRDSLVGFDNNLKAIPDTAAHAAARTGIDIHQSMFDADKKKLARNSFITMLNYQLSRQNIVATQNLGSDALNYETPLQEYLLWTPVSGSRTLANIPPAALYSTDSFGVPLKTNDPAEMEEWLSDDTYSYRRVLLDNRFSDNPSWSVWEKNGIGNNRTITLAKHYHHVVNDISGLNTLVSNNTIQNNEYVLVKNNADFDGFWTVHKYTA